jgi:hypothetical protein
MSSSLAYEFYSVHTNAIRNIKYRHELKRLFLAIYPGENFNNVVKSLIYMGKLSVVGNRLKWHTSNETKNIHGTSPHAECHKLEEVINQQQLLIELLLKQLKVSNTIR